MGQARIFLTTYPRSASVWFADYMEQAFGVSFTKFTSGSRVEISQHGNHDFLKSHEMDLYQKNQVSIIRDPMSSVSSMMAMENLFFDNSLSSIAEYRLHQYIEYYQYLAKYVDHLYLYEDVVSRPTDVISDISKRLDIDIVEYEYKNRIDRDRVETNNVRSSKKLDNYEESKEIVNSFSNLLSHAYDMYYLVKQKAITL